MGTLRHATTLLALTLASCATVRPPEAPPGNSFSIGVLIHEPDKPLRIEPHAMVFGIDSAGRVPQIGVYIRHSPPEQYRLRYVVYWQDPATRAYAPVEHSKAWRIPAGTDRAGGAYIGPDFPEGPRPGKYRFEIYIDEKVVKAFEFQLRADAP